MSDSVVIAIVAGLGGMLGWGFADFFAKNTIDKVGDMATLAWAHVYGTTILLSLVLVKHIDGQQLSFPAEWQEWGGLVFFGALQALVYFYIYRAFAKGKLSLINPIVSSYSGIVVILSVVLFGEVIGLNRFVCLGIIFLGILVMSLERDSTNLKKLKITKIKGINDALTAVALAAVWTVLWGNFVSGKDWLVYATIMYTFMFITILGLCALQKVNLKVFNPSIWKYFFLIGLAEVIAYVSVSYGYSVTTHVSIVAVLSAAFSLPTLILAYIFMGERITKIQLAGVAMVITGVVTITLI